MIRRIRLENYRSHGNTDLTLSPLTLLVGPAAAGKSNLLRALVMVQNTIHQPIAELFPPRSPWEFRLVRSRWANETDPVGFSLDLDGVEGCEAKYVLRFADSPQGIYVLEETLQRRPPDGEWGWVFQRRWPGTAEVGEFGSVGPYEPSILNRIWFDAQPDDQRAGVRFARAVAKSLWKTGDHHLETSWLKEPSDDREHDRIGYRGQDLPGYLAALKRRDPGRFDSIVLAMRELLPALDQIVMNRIGPDRQGLAMTFRGQRGFINALDLSDGTVLTLGLLAIVHAARPANLICIEEPETGLHPRRLRWLFDRFVELAYPRQGPAVQVILTTHSPYLVDFFKDMPASVLVVEQEDGRTKVADLVAIKQRLHDGTRSESIGQEWAAGLFEEL